MGAAGAIAASGSVAGLSAAGITSGLAAIGETVGGGMLVGTVIAVATPAVLENYKKRSHLMGVIAFFI